MVVSLIVLSSSLEGIPPIPSFALSTLNIEEDWSPFPTRLFYSAIFTVLGAMSFLLFWIILFSEQIPGSVDSEWHEYGTAVAYRSRGCWAQMVARWSTPLGKVPPPMNIFYLLYRLCKRLLA
jgi:hypothetical protein